MGDAAERHLDELWAEVITAELAAGRGDRAAVLLEGLERELATRPRMHRAKAGRPPDPFSRHGDAAVCVRHLMHKGWSKTRAVATIASLFCCGERDLRRYMKQTTDTHPNAADQIRNLACAALIAHGLIERAQGISGLSTEFE